jgi:ATP-dependent helicase/nuclease subunit A
MRLTARQAAVVQARGGDLLVAASAGAGKTEVLTRRCVELLADPAQPGRIDRFLIVTFTRAAAGELRIRLGNMLTAAAEASTDRAIRRHLRQQASLLDCAQIGTIDAFCQRLVRAEYLAAGIDPGFGVLDPAEATLLRKSVRRDLLEWVYWAHDPVAVEARAWIESQRRPDDSALDNLLEQLNRWREQRLDPEAWFAACRARVELPERELGEDARRRLTEALDAEFAAQLSALASAESDTAVDEYIDRLRDWRQALAEPDGLNAVILAMAGYRPAKGDTPLLAVVKKRWWDARLKKVWSPEQVSLWFESLPHAARALRMLLDLESRYNAALQAAKSRRRAYEFADIQRFALNLLYDGSAALGRPSALALRLREQYDHVLIDESQDTNAVQLALFEAVGRGGEAGNRFLVGDVKQSIYGFRGAEPHLFAELAQAFRSGSRPGRVLPLTDNFRSHPGVLSALNACFARLFSADFGGVDFTQDEKLTAGRADLQNPALDASPRVRIELIDEPDDEHTPGDDADDDADDGGDDELERIEREAWRIAAHIRDLRDRRCPVLERGPDGAPRLRPFRYFDVAVLLRTARFKAGQVTRVLRAAGLPCVASGRESLLDVLEVQDLLGVLRLLVHERQDVALAAYLRTSGSTTPPCLPSAGRRLMPTGATRWDDTSSPATTRHCAIASAPR